MRSGEHCGLPWERPDGLAQGAGICLSGGGLRAASFGLGVLQALQRDRGLLYGPGAVDYLAAVSGGSYIAAAQAINARHLSRLTDAPAGGSAAPPVPGAPLSRGSPEEEHILSHGRYLVTPLAGTLGRFGLLGGLNLLALVILFAWTGTMLADAALLVRHLSAVGSHIRPLDGAPLVLPLAGLIASVLLAVNALYRDSRLARSALAVPALAGIFLFAEPSLAGLSRYEPLRSPAHWVFLLAVTAAGLAVTAGITVWLQRMATVGIPAAAANWAAVVAVRLCGAVLMLWSAVEWFRLLSPIFGNATASTQIQAGAEFFGSLLLGFTFSYVPDRASLHREYRDRIRSCFGVVRDEPSAAVAAPDLLMSQLGDTTGREPKLLICATANLRMRAPGGGRRAYGPFVFGQDRTGIPGTSAHFPTSALELGRASGGFFRGKEPLVTLFTAVAATGAAASPSMGRRTVPSARPVLAALNIRLGRWLPNPTSARTRQAVAARTTPGRFDRDQRMGPGYDELIPEMLGLSGPRIYVSDGGHYDNLGLMALIRARCATIYCVDASPDPRGAAAELRRVTALAADELGVTCELDLAAFAAGQGGLYGTAFVAGTLTYEPGITATLIVIKLGLTARTPERLKAYRGTDRKYPHHKTSTQWYARPRMEAYRDLGFDSATQALNTLQVPPA